MLTWWKLQITKFEGSKLKNIYYSNKNREPSDDNVHECSQSTKTREPGS